ncbi:hypothetical protein Z517_07583 [Fonsecaea pedrosoi CBS 271.37]|uniref:Uncharacterized protein n=1 Tax=Fonsecaea pedrosoi CBS 271.37 TaxID=1442368 RepID=A0A0D2GGK2_9EURO|nr:uncharacterized protein Z517_07583 [Fonsecaea pedrosoi CBS 271.37]KIW77750.1 hypothetical protein Z517_07583 [Fonsecaea pedrosoi CBS 271.37]
MVDGNDFLTHRRLIYFQVTLQHVKAVAASQESLELYGLLVSVLNMEILNKTIVTIGLGNRR